MYEAYNSKGRRAKEKGMNSTKTGFHRKMRIDKKFHLKDGTLKIADE